MSKTKSLFAGAGPMGSRILPHLLICGSLSLASFAPASAAAQEQAPATTELNLSAYEAQLERCAELSKQPKEISRLRQSLPQEWSVNSGGETITVSTGWLRADLEKIERHPGKSAGIAKEIGSRLAAMRAEASELEVASSQANSKKAREHLEKILRRREFRGLAEPSSAEIAMGRLSRWLLLQFLKLLSLLHLGSATGNVLAWAVIALAFVALGYVVWKWLAKGVKSGEGKTEAPSLPSDARHWVNEALNAAQRGDYRDAIHCGYWAAVARLEDLRLLARDRARTPRESLRLLSPHPAQQKMLGDLTQYFEPIWYGFRPASAEDWSEAREKLEKMGCLNPSTAATANS